MTLVVVQCRLDSTRLPRKALLPLAGRPLLSWTLNAMKQVPADHYILAVDNDSLQELSPVAKDCGWDIFGGSKDDVLDRFCSVAAHYDCLDTTDLILRATADNPFLFYEAATQLLQEMKKNPCDYMTFTSLPHGSGVEVINACSLIKARGMTDDPYDHEHVGPALYGHPEDFASIMLPAPTQWNFPDLRTTVDTYSDYRRCLRIVRHLSHSRPPAKPYTYEEILSAFKVPMVANPVLCVPSVTKGRGTGHLRRCLDVAKKIGADLLVQDLTDVQLQDCSLQGDFSDSTLSPELLHLIHEAQKDGLDDWQFRNTLPELGEYSLILTDYFSLDKVLVQELATVGSLVAIDEGSVHTSYCDYLLDIIPSHKLGRSPNLRNSNFIPLPKNRREPVWSLEYEENGADIDADNSGVKNAALFTKILVSAGGEDPAGLSMPAAFALANLKKNVTLIVANATDVKKNLPSEIQKYLRVVPPVTNLKEKLHQYDLVITHYGFTAFEALAAGCGVILLGTSALHNALGQKYGFATISQESISPTTIQELLEKPWLLYPKTTGAVRVGAEKKTTPSRNSSLKKNSSEETLEDFVVRLASGTRILCPICGKHPLVPHPIVARTPERTFRRCSNCGIIYMSWTLKDNQSVYSDDYFFDDYKNQYGKTYLEDFDTIKNHGVRRMALIDSLFWYKRGRGGKGRHQGFIPSVLDIGCAYGPFLAAGAEAGWQVFGTDISKGAVDHVQNQLKFPAVCAPFPDFSPVQEFGIAQFDAITMWYVIEHFSQLGSVLKAVSSMLKVGGVFAFSTPSASGVSARFSPDSFFANSPADHFTLWEPKGTKEILRKFGFKVEKIVSTGHHPERFPSVKSHKTKKLKSVQDLSSQLESNPNTKTNLPPGSLLYSSLYGLSRCFRLGDTFEVYCVKTEDIN